MSRTGRTGRMHCTRAPRRAGLCFRGAAGAALTLGCAIAVRTAASQAPQAPVRTLGKPLAEFPEGFSVIGAVRELRNGRVVVLDSKDRVLLLADFAAGTSAKVSRQGGGPLEYTMPGALLALPGDSTLVVDLMQRRFLALGPDATPIRTIPFAGNTGDPMAMLRMPILTAADRRGYAYGTGLPTTMGRGGVAIADTVSLVRQRLSDGQLDTLAIVRFPSGDVSMSQGAGGAISIRMTPRVFEPRDAWAAFPDGRVAVVRGADYHVEWIGADKAVRRTPPIPFDRVRIGADAKKTVMDSMRTMMEKSFGAGLAAVEARGNVPRPSIEIDEPERWPEYYSPVASAFAATDGHLWVARMGIPGDKIARYDVLDANGKLLYAVRFPERTTLLGFGNGVLYAVRVDDDDLQYLGRYAIP